MVGGAGSSHSPNNWNHFVTDGGQVLELYQREVKPWKPWQSRCLPISERGVPADRCRFRSFAAIRASRALRRRKGSKAAAPGRRTCLSSSGWRLDSQAAGRWCRPSRRSRRRRCLQRRLSARRQRAGRPAARSPGCRRRRRSWQRTGDDRALAGRRLEEQPGRHRAPGSSPRRRGHTAPAVWWEHLHPGPLPPPQGGDLLAHFPPCFRVAVVVAEDQDGFWHCRVARELGEGSHAVRLPRKGA